jgi:hypothetical protein
VNWRPAKLPGPVRISRSGFDFTCPWCGDAIHEQDEVMSLPIAPLVQGWSVCMDCGVHWAEAQS